LDNVIKVFKPGTVSVDAEDMRFMGQPVQRLVRPFHIREPPGLNDAPAVCAADCRLERVVSQFLAQ
jgi:hypothetical protein